MSGVGARRGPPALWLGLLGPAWRKQGVSEQLSAICARGCRSSGHLGRGGSQNHGLLLAERDLKGHILPRPAMVLPRSPQKADPKRKDKGRICGMRAVD